MRHLAATLLVTSIAIPAVTVADTVIQQKSGDGGNTTISIKGDWARLDNAGDSEYQLWNLKTGEMNMVIPEDRTIMVINLRSEQSKKKQRPIKATVKKSGKGPKIAGYATTEYTVMAAGKRCGKEYISSAAAKSPEIRHLVDNFAALANLDELMPGPMGAIAQSMQDPCDLASQSLGDQLPKLGMPLKSTDANGRVETEVTRIDTHAKLDAKRFELPADYKRTTMKEMMDEAMKEMQQMMQSIPPEGQQMLQQLFQKPQ